MYPTNVLQLGFELGFFFKLTGRINILVMTINSCFIKSPFNLSRSYWSTTELGTTALRMTVVYTDQGLRWDEAADKQWMSDARKEVSVLVSISELPEDVHV